MGGSVVFAVLLIGLLLWNPQTETKRTSSAEPLVFYCAAGIKPPVEEVVRAYEEEYGVTIRLQYGGSGTLLSNIRAAQVGDL